MAIRDKNLNWTDEAIDLSVIITQKLRPIYESYKDKFTPEEIQYIINDSIMRIITRDMVERKQNRFMRFRNKRGNK